MHPLPVAIGKATSVPYNNSFLLVGGEDQPSWVNTVYEFDVESEDWILHEEQLSYVNSYVSAMMVSTDLFPACSH